MLETPEAHQAIFIDIEISTASKPNYNEPNSPNYIKQAARLH
jgi:hypothetical protein